MEAEPSRGETPERYPENVPGPFCVEMDLCFTCRVPETEAPDLIGFYEAPSGTHRKSHCYFKKQPETPEELDRAIEAVRLCCCGAMGYDGDDPDVLRRLNAPHGTEGDGVIARCLARLRRWWKVR